MSQAVRKLEGQLGAVLLQRSTRSVHLTEAGERLYATVAPALADVRTAVAGGYDAGIEIGEVIDKDMIVVPVSGTWSSPSWARRRRPPPNRWCDAYVQSMADASKSRNAGSSGPTTAKERNAIQRSVKTLLDLLAPERATSRSERAPVRIEPYRTPSGCVLQAPTAALSVAWFPGGAATSELGQLHVVLWRGAVTRRGGGVPRESAGVLREWTLRPIDVSSNVLRWREDGDGTEYDIQGLADHCLALLNHQVQADDPTDSATPTTPRRRD